MRASSRSALRGIRRWPSTIVKIYVPSLYLYSRGGTASRPAVYVCGLMDHKSASVNSIGSLEASRLLSLKDMRAYLSWKLWDLQNIASD